MVELFGGFADAIARMWDVLGPHADRSNGFLAFVVSSLVNMARNYFWFVLIGTALWAIFVRKRGASLSPLNALRYLLPKRIKNNGLKEAEIGVSEAAVRDIIRYYTREAGVRSLEREISKICRKVVKMLLLKKQERKIQVTGKNLDKFCGVRRFNFGVAEKENQIGQVTGLAWTEVGGELLTIEAVAVPGKGRTTTTGKLGDVMQESIKAAMSVMPVMPAISTIISDADRLYSTQRKRLRSAASSARTKATLDHGIGRDRSQCSSPPSRHR